MSVVRGVAAGFTLRIYSNGIGQLGEGFGGRDAYACWQTYPLLNASTDGAGAIEEVALNAA